MSGTSSSPATCSAASARWPTTPATRSARRAPRCRSRCSGSAASSTPASASASSRTSARPASAPAERSQRLRAEELANRRPVSLDDLFARIREGGLKELNIIIKGDVQGSVGALSDALERVEQTEVRLRVIHTGVGAITESDVMLASASQAIIIGFNVRPRPEATVLADREGVDIRTYRVIYRAIEDVRDALVGLLEPDIVEDVDRPARGAGDLPRQPHRHDRRLLRHRGDRAPQLERAAPPRGDGGARGPHRVAEALQRGRARGERRLRVRPADRGLQRRQGGRRDRGVRAARGRPHVPGRGRPAPASTPAPAAAE